MSYLHLHIASKSEKLITFEEPSKIFTKIFDKNALGDKVYDTKTIWGSDLVKFAVNQANDALELEETLAETNFLLICPKESPTDPYENVILNEVGNVIFYCLRSYQWTPGFCRTFCECWSHKFGYRLLNTSYREVLHVGGTQCCYASGSMKVSSGLNLLGSIHQRPPKKTSDGYIIKNPDGSACMQLLKMDNTGHYDILNSQDTKVGEVRKALAYSPIGNITILYGLAFVKDIPIHEKHLMLGASFLLYYQKYGSWNNKRRFQWSVLCKVVSLLTILIISALFVIYYQS